MHVFYAKKMLSIREFEISANESWMLNSYPLKLEMWIFDALSCDSDNMSKRAVVEPVELIFMEVTTSSD
jgi:hypothetical protein